MTKRLLLIVAILLFFAAPAVAGFDEVVSAIESRYHVRHTSIPFFGLVRFAVRVTHYDGVSDLQLVTWEEPKFDDMREVAKLVKQHVGEGFQPIVQAWQRDGECSLIYAKPAGGDKVAMLIFAQDHSDTTLLRVVVSVEQFAKAVNDPEHVASRFD